MKACVCSQILANADPGRRRWRGRQLSSCHPCRRPGLSSQLLALIGPCPGFVGIQGMNQWKEALYLSAWQINKSMNKNVYVRFLQLLLKGDTEVMIMSQARLSLGSFSSLHWATIKSLCASVSYLQTQQRGSTFLAGLLCQLYALMYSQPSEQCLEHWSNSVNVSCHHHHHHHRHHRRHHHHHRHHQQQQHDFTSYPFTELQSLSFS